MAHSLFGPSKPLAQSCWQPRCVPTGLATISRVRVLPSQAASALNHPHICTFHEVGEQDSQAFVVMECLDGVTLKYKIAGRPRCLRGLHRASGEPKSMAARVFGGNRPSSQKRESRQALCPGECSLILLCVAILLYCQSEHLSGSFLIVIKPHLLP
jgi:serine/threonine protein kinase